MRILGIDPGSHNTGFGVIEQKLSRSAYITSGVIRIGKYTWPERLRKLFEGLFQIISEHMPEVMVVEKIFVDKNVSSALKLGQIRGVAMVTAALHNIPIAEYTPRQIKKAVVGYGAAEKRQIQHMMQTLLKLSGLPQSDAADALAAALCHGQMTRGIDFNPIKAKDVKSKKVTSKQLTRRIMQRITIGKAMDTTG